MLNKKIFTLFVSAAFASSAFAQWTKPVINTQKDLVVGDTVYLYNTEAKMFFTEGTSTSNQWKTNANLGNEGLKVVVNQYVANEGDVWDGKTYTISDFSVQKNGWYNLFVNGAEGAYGSAFVDRGNQVDYMWEMAKQENGTYHIWAAGEAFGHEAEGFEECYFGGIVSNGEQLTEAFPLIDMSQIITGDVPQIDWTFVSVEDYDAYLASYVVYNAAQQLLQKINEGAERGVDVSEAQAVYDNTSSTKEQLEEAIALINKLEAEKDEQTVTPDNPLDYTSAITNPNFDSKTEGWLNDAGLETFETGNWVTGDGFDGNYLNLWGTKPNGKVHQTVENLPNGIYRVSAGVYTDATGVFFYVGDIKKEIALPAENGKGSVMTIVTQVTDHTLDLGLEVTDEKTHWFCMDKVSLEYIGSGTDAYMAWLKDYAENTPDLANVKAQPALVAEYKAVLEAIDEASTKEQLSELLPQFDDISTRLNDNIAAYQRIDDLKEYILGTVLETANEYYSAKLSALSDSCMDIIEALELDTESLNALAGEIERLIGDSEYNAEYKTVLAAKVEELETAANETYKNSASKESLEEAAAHVALGKEMGESNALSNDSIYNYINKADEILRELAIPTGDASDTNPLDYTILIVNPGFEDGNTGWTNEAGMSTFGNDTYLIDDEIFVGAQYLNLWHATGITGRIYQRLEGLRNGTYEISAAAYSNAEGVSLFAGNATASLDMLNVGTVLSVVVKVTDGTLDFGAFINTTGECWCCFDNFTLTYFGENSEAQPTEGNETLTGVESIATSESAAEFYSLSGARLSSPVKGVNLVKKNGKVSKVIVK